MNAAVHLPIVRPHVVWNGSGVSHSIPLQLTPEDKLDLLRYLDEFHYWHSLDDERSCKRCGRTINGRQIVVIELEGTRGKLRLQCPSAGCVSSPGDWAYANPVRVAKLRRGDLGSAEPLQRTHQPNGRPVLAKTRRASPDRAVKPNHVSLRAVIARWPLLGTLATALRVIHPIA
jgi:hypothetical protein